MAVTTRTGDVGVNVFSHAVLIGWSVMVLVPLAWALLASVKTSGEIFGSPWSLPEVFQWSNFARAWDKGVGEYLLNSVIVVTGGVVLTMLLGSMAADVLARYQFPGDRLIYYLFAAGDDVPGVPGHRAAVLRGPAPGHAVHHQGLMLPQRRQSPEPAWSHTRFVTGFRR
jgi:ABC-type glycerol-3-phosphate transport system permease component